jgi:hypothetical protein
MLDHILEEVNFAPDDVEEYIQKFSAIEKLNPEKFYFKKEPEKLHQVPERQEKPEGTPVQKPTVNDSLSNNAKPMLVDNFQRIQRIKEKLTINQKFMFTKVLFNGDFEYFSKTIDELDQKADMPSALQYLEQHYNDWDKESEEFHEFMEMVEKRFS